MNKKWSCPSRNVVSAEKDPLPWDGPCWTGPSLSTDSSAGIQSKKDLMAKPPLPSGEEIFQREIQLPKQIHLLPFPTGLPLPFQTGK